MTTERTQARASLILFHGVPEPTEGKSRCSSSTAKTLHFLATKSWRGPRPQTYQEDIK